MTTMSLEIIYKVGTFKEEEKSFRSFLKKTKNERPRSEYSGRSEHWKIDAGELLKIRPTSA